MHVSFLHTHASLFYTPHPPDIQGTEDLLRVGGSKIVPTIPQLILPLKTALDTRDLHVVGIALRLLQQLATSSQHAGRALVPYYRQLLPVVNLFVNRNQVIGKKAGETLLLLTCCCVATTCKRTYAHTHTQMLIVHTYPCTHT